jgi:hypothetical protein
MFLYRKLLFFSRVLFCKRSWMEGLFWTWNGWLVFSFWLGLKSWCASCIMEHAQYRVCIRALAVVRCPWGIWVESAKLSNWVSKWANGLGFKTECLSWFAQGAWWIFKTMVRSVDARRATHVQRFLFSGLLTCHWKIALQLYYIFCCLLTFLYLHNIFCTFLVGWTS